MKNKRTGLLLAGALLAVIVGIGVMVMTVADPGQQGGRVQRLPAKDPDPTAPVQQTQPSEETTEPDAQTAPATQPPQETEPTVPPDLIELETPYCALYFPVMWEDHLHIEPVQAENDRIAFGCRLEGDEVYRLFDVAFGATDGTVLGTVAGPDGTETVVSILFHEPPQTLNADERETFLAMQEDANVLISLLPLTGGQAQTQAGGDMRIETPFRPLSYPGQWEEYLLVEQEGGAAYALHFLAQLEGLEQIRLFTLKFGVAGEEAALTITDEAGRAVGVGVELHEIPAAGLTAQQLDTLYAMQDAMNDLLEELAAYAVG